MRPRFSTFGIQINTETKHKKVRHISKRPCATSVSCCRNWAGIAPMYFSWLKDEESANAKTQVLLRANKQQRKMAKLPKCT